LLPPRKRFRDSYSSEESGDEHMEIGTVEADLSSGDGVKDHAEDDLGVRVKIVTGEFRDDEEEYEAEASAGGTIEIVVDPLATGGISKSKG
ncbi:hypothetical protein Tco_0427274, partial [Tanacetum coccineum]